MTEHEEDARTAMMEAIDHAVETALEILSHRQIADELRRIAQGWEDAA